VASTALEFWITVALLAAVPIQLQAAPLNSRGGTLQGVVADSAGDPIRSVSVSIPKLRWGTHSDSQGRFCLRDMPAGQYRLVANKFGCPSATFTAHVRSNQVTEIKVVMGCPELRGRGGRPRDVAYHLRDVVVNAWRGMSDSAAARESIGVEVSLKSADLECQIRPGRASFHVGDQPEFSVRLINHSGHEFLLVRSLDGSMDRARFPYVWIDVRGPVEGVTRPRPVYFDDHLNDLSESDFVAVPPGGVFDPFGAVSDLGQFVKPGRYTAVFHYCTNQPDVRKWLGWPKPFFLRASISRLFRRVPMLEDSCSVKFEVRP